MRIAFVTEVFLPKIDGITNRLRHTIAELVAKGHEVLVIAPQDAAEEHAGARVVRVPGPPFPPYPGLRVSLPDPRILWELSRFAPDVVHAVNPVCLGIWGSLAARLLNLPLVASYHTDLPRYLPSFGMGWARPMVWPLLRGVHELAARNLAPSRFTRDELEHQGIESVGLWRGGVDTGLFHPGRRSLAMRVRMTGGRPDAPVMLYVGRVSPEKNLGLLARILDATPGLRLAVVGDGPAREELEKEVFAGRDAVFLGFLRGEELAAAFASADVFVMPSRTETLGFVVLEAMSAGCPVVAARAGGIPDLVDHEETGILYDPDDEEQAVRAVQALLAHRGRRAFHARLARKKAEGCSWAAETAKLVDEYRKTIVRHRSASRVARLRRMLFA